MIRFAIRSNICTKHQKYTKILRSQNGRSLHSEAPFQQAGFGKYILILSPIAAGAGVVAYAKYDDKFRQTLVQNVPGIDPVLKVLLQEEGNALEKASNTVGKATQKIGEVSSTVTGFFSSSKDEDKSVSVPVKLSITHAPVSTPKKDAESATPPLPAISPPQPVQSTAKAKTTKEAKSIVDVPKPIPITITLPKNIAELESMVEVASQTAVQEYAKAINVLKIYNEDIKKILDDDILDKTVWVSLKNKTSARDCAVEVAETAAHVARASIDKLEKSISEFAKDATPEIIENVRNNIKKYTVKLNAVKDELYNNKDIANLSEKYWKNVQSARNYFIEEVEALCPGINLGDKKLDISKDDLDLFLMYAYSHVVTYQKELQKLQIEGETRIRRIHEALRGDDQHDALQNQLEFHLETEKQKLNIENQKTLFKIQADAEKQLRQQMKRQAEAHADHLNDALSQKEIELKRVFNRELNEKLSNEQAAYKAQVAAMLGKVKGMDAALNARADADRMVHQAQALWSACQALWASVRAGQPGVPWQQQLRPLANEVSAVGRAAEGDELVAVVLQGVPAEAKTRGVYPEDALKERFIKVDKLARRVAMVPEEGARLPIYLLSFIQSMFILTPENPISQEELNNEPIDISKLDTYDILNRAKYWLERGNLTQSLKYMNLLQGAPRNIAKDWVKEARLLLETQQAANTLMAHAATSGLSFL